MADRDDEHREGKLHLDAVAQAPRPDPQGFYAVLGLPISADAAAVRKAYLHQSTLFHTDRHVDSTMEQRQVMNERFQKINEAYQILSDPRRRAAYDHAGGAGVDRLELLPGTVSERSDVIRALDALAREAEVRKLAKMVGSSGSVELSINALHLRPQRQFAAPVPAEAAATKRADAGAQLQLKAAQMGVTVADINGVKKIVLVPADGVVEQALPPEARAQLQALLGRDTSGLASGGLRPLESIKAWHQFQHAFSNSFAMIVRAEAKQDKQGSSGSLLVRAVYVASAVLNFAAAVRVSMDRVKVGVMMTRSLSPIWTLITKLGLYNGRAFVPELSTTLRRALSESVTVTNTVKWTLLEKGGSFDCAIAQQSEGGKVGRGVALHLARGSLQLSLFRSSALRWSIGQWSGDGSRVLSVSADCLKGTTTANCQVWWDRSAFYSLGFGVTHQLPLTLSPFAPPFFLAASRNFVGFTQYSLLYRRGEHTLSLPMIVALTPNAIAAFAVAVAPFALWSVAMRVARPLLLVKAARKVAAARRLRAAEVEAARLKAAMEQDAIRGEVLLRQQREGKNGLIIMNAKYGVLRPTLPALEGEPVPVVVDVTLSLQSYVRDAQLDVPAGDMSHLVGFYDPDPSSGEPKHLRVQYWFNQRRHDVEVADGAAFHLPDDEHRLRASPLL